MYFSGLDSGRKIGSVREVLGLYYFENESSVSGHVQVVVENSSPSRKQKIMVLHSRPAYPSFFNIKHVFPSLFHKEIFIPMRSLLITL